MNEEQQIIYNKLIHLHNKNNITNIILYGNTKSGKKTILEHFLLELYKTKEIFKKYLFTIYRRKKKNTKLHENYFQIYIR